MTLAISAFGTQLQMGDDAVPPNYTTIAEVTTIGGPSLASDTEDVTSHQSAGAWEEHIPTILRSGEVSLDINYVPYHATHNVVTGLLYAFNNRVLKAWKLIFPDVATTTFSFNAYVTGFEMDAPHDGKLGAAVTLKITGAPVLA